MKTCTKCGETKALTEFHKDKRARLGRRSACKNCIKASDKARYEANKEEKKAYSKAYREANPEKVKACKKAWYEANPEKAKASDKAWYEVNKEKVKTRQLSPVGKFSQYKSSAKKRDIPFLIEYKQFEGLYQQPCAYCGAEIKTIGLDRIDSSGPYHIDNVVPCCWSCNKDKGTKTLEEWTEITLARSKRLNPEEFNK